MRIRYAFKLGLSGLPSFLDGNDSGEVDDGFVTSASRTHEKERENKTLLASSASANNGGLTHNAKTHETKYNKENNE